MGAADVFNCDMYHFMIRSPEAFIHMARDRQRNTALARGKAQVQSVFSCGCDIKLVSSSNNGSKPIICKTLGSRTS